MEPDEFKQHCKEALLKLPLTEKQAEQTANAFAKHTTWGRGGFLEGIKPDSPFFYFKAKVDEVINTFATNGLTEQDYIKAALKQPQLFTLSPTTIASNIRGVVDAFKDAGLTEKDYIKAALKQPPLFYQSPTTIANNIRGVVDAFKDAKLTEKDYIKAALKQPPLFTLSPTTIASNIRGVVDAFKDAGLTEKDYIKAALKHPPLFYQSPTTINAHIHYWVAVMDRQQHIQGRVEVPRAEQQKQALKMLLNNPAFISYADNNIQLRETYLTALQGKAGRLFYSSRKPYEDAITAHLGHEDLEVPVAPVQPEDSSDERNKKMWLRALIRSEVLKSGSLGR